MSDDPRGLEHLRFEYIIPEFARPDFKLPSEEDKEREWAIIGTIFQGYKLIDPEKVKAHMKGNEPMDEELFTEEAAKRLTEPEGAAPRNSEYYETLVVDIETYTNHALKLQTAVIEAESKLAKAKRRHRKADLRLAKASQQWSEADRALDDARAMLEKHLNLIRKTHVTLRKGRHE